MTRSALVLLAIALVPAESALRCRYTVRDVAFVAFAGDRYTLDVEVPEGTPEGWTDTLRRIARASLADTDVEMKTTVKEGAGVPRATLRAADGRSLEVPVPADVKTLEKEGWDALDALGHSKARDRYKARCLEAHAVIVVFEGPEKADNARAVRLASEAIAMATTLRELPKPSKAGPEVLVVPYADRAAERVFHWATGAHAEEEGDAQVAVLYGRGRRMGPVLAGPVITASDIKQALLMIGQDCECELPRTIMRGPMVPLAWSTEDADRAQEVLGFDGRNPMVKQEIARIVARESTAPGAPKPVGVDPLGLGYHEAEIDAPGVAPQQAPDGDGPVDSEISLADEAPAPADMAQGVSLVLAWVFGAILLGVLAIVGVLYARGSGRA